ASSLGVLLEPLAQLRQPARGLFLVARRLEWVAALERLLRALHVAGGLPQLGARLGIERRLFGTLVELLGEAVRRGAGFALARRVGAHLLALGLRDVGADVRQRFVELAPQVPQAPVGLAGASCIAARLSLVAREHEGRQIEIARQTGEIARRRLGHPARLAEIARRERVLRVDDALARAVVGVLLEAGEAGAIDLLERPPHRARAIREPPRLPLVARARGLGRALGRGARKSVV